MRAAFRGESFACSVVQGKALENNSYGGGSCNCPEGDVPLSVWEQSEKGQDLSIVYLRDEPSESRPLAGSPFWHWFGVIFLICFWGIPGLACLFIAIVEFWELAKKSVLFRRGAHVHR